MIGRLLDLRGLADGSNPASLSNRLRSRRFELFERLTSTLPRPVRILDVGGTTQFWEQRGWAGRDGVLITLVNPDPQPARHANVLPVVGDGTSLREFADRSFDVVFSNSVLEHLATRAAQAAMASEIRRVGTSYWVQTPNFWFPVEPHFLFPGWQWLPLAVRIGMLRRYRMGWRGPCPEPADARRAVEEIRLLRKRELGELFPGGRILAERFLGWPKSWVVVEGLPC